MFWVWGWENCRLGSIVWIEVFGGFGGGEVGLLSGSVVFFFLVRE